MKKIIACSLALLICHCSFAQNESYRGGSADGHARDEQVTPFAFPVSFQPFLGGSGDGYASVSVINAVFPFPDHFFAFLGGSNDGWTGNLQTGVPVLPLTLLQFRAIEQGGMNLLIWHTEQEVNTSHFEIERSANGGSFQRSQRTAAKGNFTGRSEYRVLDSIPLSGKNYYRIKMVDMDSSFKYSPIVLIDRRKDITALVLYPNPVTQFLQVKLSDPPQKELSWTIVDMQGRTVVQQKTNGGAMLYGVNVQHLPKGNYILQVTTDLWKEAIQFSKQ
jgi:hypothetical protein